MDLDLYSRILIGGGSIALVPERVYRYRRHPATMTAANSRTLVRLDEETAVCREVAAAAREKGWGRSARLARMRPTVRLNGVLESAKLVVDRQFRLARSAAKRSLTP